ncbi:MAG TPA: LuxR C-terminal-related transcriptional regulator [Patescibacteria group bacterium]|nr:LuxR C-terminal-related transcriptional regulator [Patescibacteria group bacterium]
MTLPLYRTIPARRSRIIGRGAELETIRQRLADADVRLLTLTGVGGIGKTTIAAEAGRVASERRPDAAVFVDLSSARDTDDVTLRCCDALGILQHGRAPIALLVDHLVPRQLLLVLDNCEHVVGPVRTVLDRLLDRCPDLTVLATSRAPLRVRGERVLVIPPMPLPDAGATSMESLLASPAVALFVDRASAADPSFALGPDTAQSVAAICRRVEGIPLAVELVAAQAAALTPREIERRLDDWATTGRDGAARPDQPMDATLDWSYDLLSPRARTLFRRLAAFAGGWTIESAEALLAPDHEAGAMPAALVELVENSLVIRGWQGDASRYRLLAPVAEYAAHRLDDPTERHAARIAHATYYLGLVGRPAIAFPMSESDQLDLVAVEYDNCEAAMRMAEDAGLASIVTGFALSLLTFWGVRGLLHTAIRRLEAALALLGPGPSRERAALLGGLAAYTRLLGRHATANELAGEAGRMFEAVGDRSGQATALGIRGEIATDLDDLPAAYAHYERARDVLGDAPDPVLLAVWHGNVGGIALLEGDLERARRELERAYGLLAGADTWYLVPLLARLGRLDRIEGRTEHAAQHLRAALRHTRRYGARVDGIRCLEELARLALDQGDPERGATLLGAAAGMRDACALHLLGRDRRTLAADIERARATQPARSFDKAWGRGHELSLDLAIDFAESSSTRPAARTGRPSGSELTAREAEIASLVALGLTNKEIAARLSIAPGTVRIHVERILGRLGLTSRVQVATWVVRAEAEQAVSPLCAKPGW